LLVPYIPQTILDNHRGGINITVENLASEEGRRGTLNALRRHLIYCNAVAVENPLLFQCSLALHSMHFEVPLLHRRILANYIRFLSLTAPLVDNGTLVLVESDVRHVFKGAPGEPAKTDHVGRKAAAQAMRRHRRFDEVFESDYGNWESRFLDSFKRDAAQEYARAIDVGLQGAAEFNLDLYLTHPLLIEGLKQFGRSDAAHAIEVRELLALPMPNLESLALEDIASVRREEDSFREWQIVLQDVIRGAAERLARNPDVDNDELAVEAQARLRPAQERIERRIQQSSVLASAKRGLRELGVGVLAASPLAAFSPKIGGVAAVGATTRAATELLWRYATVKKDPSAKALYRHFMVFRAN
jgi:hypothetical protein